MSHISRFDLHAFIDGGLTGDREPKKREIEEHLESCEECEKLLLKERNRVHLVSEALSELKIPEHILESFPTAEEMRAIARGGAEEASIIPIKKGAEARGRRRARIAAFFPQQLILKPSWQAAATIVLCLGSGYALGVRSNSNSSGDPTSYFQQAEIKGLGDAQLSDSLLVPMIRSVATTLSIPGLTVRDVRLSTELSAADTAILVVHELPDGRPVEVHHLPLPQQGSSSVMDLIADIDDDLPEETLELYAGSLPEGWRMLVLPGVRPGEFVILRGPLTDAELTDLSEGFLESGSLIPEPGEVTTDPDSVEVPSRAIGKGIPLAEDDLSIPEIRTGERVLGSLEVGDITLEDSSFADLWMYRARAGHTVTIDLFSEDFDAYLLIGNEGAERLAEDDDSGEGTDSRISFTPTESTSYGIVVNSYSENGVGRYALSVTLEDPDTESTGRAPDLSEPDWETFYPENGDPNDRYALIVGIADYPGSDGDLIGPDVDAREFRELLIDEFGFQESNIVTLTDSEATRDHIVQAFSRHLGQAGPDGVAVFFYSGHGTQLEGNFGLTGVYDPEFDGQDEAILVWGSTEYANISDDELGILADRLEANRTLIVMDACHTGTGTRTTSDGRQAKWTNIEDIMQSLERSAETVVRMLTEVSDPRRHVLLAASRDQEKAYTDPEFGYGVFTRMLVEEMRNASALETFDEMMARVQQRTLERTQGDQTPQTAGRLSSSRIREFLSRNR
jgi:hypothetical protein